MNREKYEDYLMFLRENDLIDESMLKTINEKVCAQIVDILLEECPKKILEIGRFKGCSLGMFRFFVPQSHVVSIDIKNYSEAKAISDFFGENVLLNGSSDLLKDMKDVFDLILIDGDHSYAGCLNDWRNIQNSMAPKCTVLFDDLQHPRGCGKVFYDIDDDKYSKQLIIADGIECMGVLRK